MDDTDYDVNGWMGCGRCLSFGAGDFEYTIDGA
jgi:hypothetical protein